MVRKQLRLEPNRECVELDEAAAEELHLLLHGQVDQGDQESLDYQDGRLAST